MSRDIVSLLKNRKIIILVILIAGLFSVGYVGFAYLERDPTFCASCHLMEEPFEKWRVSAMHNVSCIECHEQNVIDSINILVKAFVYNPQNITRHAEIKPETCLKCHGSGEGEYAQVLKEAGHVTHYIDEGIDCTECHGVQLHVFKPTLQLCSSCHLIKVETKSMESHCLNCHQFTSEDVPLTPSTDECMYCHNDIISVSPAFADAHESSDCVECHSPHKFPLIFSCNFCHSSGGIGLHDIHQQFRCENCHKPHSEDLDIRSLCTECHVDRVGHMKGRECIECHQF